MELPTRSSIKKAFQKNRILVNGKIKKSGYWIEAGDEISLKMVALVPKKVLDLVIPVIFEDDYLAIVHKPAGIRTSGNQFYTLEHALSKNLKLSTQLDAIRPIPVHRLDLQTSGLVLIAKTRKTRILLGNQFEEKKIQKQYHAVVIGKISPQGVLDYPIENKPSITYFESIQVRPSLKNKYLSLVKLTPKTGRTHQLRIHLSRKGHPILGDKPYGIEGLILKKKGLFLCATGLSFTHPILGTEIFFEIAIPNKFETRMQAEARRYANHSE